MEEMLTWLYGKSARNAHIRMMAKKVIEILSKSKEMEYMDLCKKLDIALNKYKKPKRTFYFVVNPLKKIELIKEKRVYLTDERKKYKTLYHLNPDTFYGYMKKTLDNFYSSIKNN